ncbi:hypothetical protein SEA_YABOI_276 [Streptomyces phage Yaboi]|jgi:hypothetical protein|uniref:Uncharacterized protein n=3 Tax=Streptomyces virus Yaboi TaxID=2846408 RepID=A0A411C4Y3_9CAUD|nr:hypothetical protein HWB86_gp015 [Streptomyces phage Yaboi]YP_009841367.1 hypothetical protein HWB86_gp051 [Streptomyces phage Yaboi]QAY08677.1 hypothetical protein SEA_GENIE2_15 [Streptomyces phage Genie2]QAY12667.1 hypothetical protein SEA_BOOMERJR_15 [Streptomyces phage BoomerJR]UVD39863.1 membrane protein [Streptomyces phage Stanimal]WNM73604.1 hypothetical protein SEA_SOLLERTIA_15 [Streptomyces phage Sollertia]AYB70854.1 hypothetical protein SEA_YABOI_15 [Streptomyces phage Yaboi]
MYNIKGPITASNVNGPTAVLLFLVNIGITAFLIMVIGALLHIGWNWI